MAAEGREMQICSIAHESSKYAQAAAAISNHARLRIT